MRVPKKLVCFCPIFYCMKNADFVFQNAQTSFSVVFRLKIAIPNQLSSDRSFSDFSLSPQKETGKERCLLSSIVFLSYQSRKTSKNWGS